MEVDQPPPNNSREPRKDYLASSDYYMAAAVLTSKQSRDPNTQVGACIVKDKKIVGLGYNSMPGYFDNNNDWAKNSANILENKELYVCHAVLNAITNTFCADLKDCAIYVTLFPCSKCLQLIVQNGIKKLYYLSDCRGDAEIVAAKKICDKCSIEYQRFVPNNNIDLNFDVFRPKI